MVREGSANFCSWTIILYICVYILEPFAIFGNHFQSILEASIHEPEGDGNGFVKKPGVDPKIQSLKYHIH